MRFTAPVTCLAVSGDHTLLAAGSSEFSVKVLELHSLPSSFSLVAHEAPVLSVTFNPHGEFLVMIYFLNIGLINWSINNSYIN